ncbi:unnamed protein product, partial [Heterosigma akashiwo]
MHSSLQTGEFFQTLTFMADNPEAVSHVLVLRHHKLHRTVVHFLHNQEIWASYFYHHYDNPPDALHGSVLFP